MTDLGTVQELVNAADLRPVPMSAAVQTWLESHLNADLCQTIANTMTALGNWMVCLLDEDPAALPPTLDERVFLVWADHLRSHAQSVPDRDWLSGYLAYCERLSNLIAELRRHAGLTRTFS
ncbi:hypothetical protein ACFQDE_21045 [Deinococcus caeni]|uniref:Uncharacterized protein n=1 Tax=Deinococcus caeni TaxID=569127 RepID=A0ABP9UG41_9DEIO